MSSLSVKMSSQEDYFKVLWKVLNLVGLKSTNSNFLPSLIKLSTFILLMPFLVIILIGSAFGTDDPGMSFIVYRSMPYFLIISLKYLYFKFYSKKIKSMIDDFEVTLKDVPDNLLVKYHKQAMKWLKIYAFIAMVPYTFIQVASLAKGEGSMPIWIPPQFSGYEKAILYPYLVLQTASSYYAGLLIIALDGLVIYLLIQFKGYSDFLCLSFAAISDEKKADRNRKLVSAFRHYGKFRRW